MQGHSTFITYIRINGDEFEVPVTIAGTYLNDWNFNDEDLSFDHEFEPFREKITSNIRANENKLIFYKNDEDYERFAEYGV